MTRITIESTLQWHSWNSTFIAVVRYSITRIAMDLQADILKPVFLTNTTPAKCHIHTINRLPNRGDYGKALLEQRPDE
jgi:hypothetical protein